MTQSALAAVTNAPSPSREIMFADGTPSASDAEGASGPLSRRVLVLLLAVIAAHALLSWQVRARDVFTSGDDAAYLLLGRALRAFSYREVQFIGEPVAARFPPGYPAVLAILGSFGERLGVMAAAGIAFSVSGLIALFDVIRRRWSEQLALLVTAVVAVNPAVVSNAGAIASEAMFTTATLWALWAADRSDHGDRRDLVAGAAAIVSAMTRTAGVTVPVALGLHWLLRRRHRLLTILALASALTVGVWLSWTMVAPRREVRRSYIDDAVNIRSGDGSMVGTLATRVRTNAVTYGGQELPSELGLPLTRRTRLDNLAWVALLGVLGFAGLASAWRRWNAAVLWVVVYAGLLLVWAFTLGRFLQPALPVAIAFVLAGAWTIGGRLGRGPRWAGAGAVMTGALLAACGLSGSAHLVAQAIACDRARVDCAPAESLDYIDATKYLATSTPPDARLIVPKNATVYYFAPRKSVFWDEVIVQDSASFLPFLERTGVRYILTTPIYSDQLTVARLALMHCPHFDLVRAFSPETLILMKRDVPTADRNTPACRALVRAVGRATVRAESSAYQDTFRIVNARDSVLR